ncbi:CLUMA_CG019396, isoform A [Clunio marinus]|uniref:CLUMA_CG019396, isoform A n=1 Tax=Clunio marinus TaxID=568069 RepID=A0A1J1J227_9DIPT|nr:CLUMA_CG019396, isoform A [Clunio marinus]
MIPERLIDDETHDRDESLILENFLLQRYLPGKFTIYDSSHRLQMFGECQCVGGLCETCEL